jgi:hypothetical protein
MCSHSVHSPADASGNPRVILGYLYSTHRAAAGSSLFVQCDADDAVCKLQA